MYLISANIAGYGLDKAVVWCFEPTMVIARLRDEFPEVEVISEDLAWRDYDDFRQHGVEGKALRMAEIDARRRGPIWKFLLPVAGKPAIVGWAERYSVKIRSAEPIPEPLRSRFLAFLEKLRFCDHVTVTSVRLEGNREYPA
jgi:hypothetical protein